MRYWKKIKDINKREVFIKHEILQRLVKILYFHFDINALRFSLLNIYSVVNKNSFKTRVNNICVISGRSRSIHKKFKLSRILIRELSGQSLFFGLKKASW